MDIEYVRICVLKCEQSYEWARKVLSRFLFKTRYFMHYLVRLREQKNGTLIMTYLDNIYFDPAAATWRCTGGRAKMESGQISAAILIPLPCAMMTTFQ